MAFVVSKLKLWGDRVRGTLYRPKDVNEAVFSLKNDFHASLATPKM
jgi:hypothetical protein